MLFKSHIKLIHSLEQKKFRREEHAFVAEGHKCVGDLLREGFRARLIVATDEWQVPVALPMTTEVVRVTADELRRASLLQHPQQVVAVFELPRGVYDNDVDSGAEATQVLTDTGGEEALVVCLDDVQDPGNVGTIIRTADWFGVRHIVCSPHTADAYAPKTVQATMGSIARVRLTYTDVAEWLSSLPPNVPVYATMLDGDDVYASGMTGRGVVVMGNEGRGVSDEVARCVTRSVLIPPFPRDRRTAESLNVSIATAIILAEMRRKG